MTKETTYLKTKISNEASSFDNLSKSCLLATTNNHTMQMHLLVCIAKWECVMNCNLNKISLRGSKSRENVNWSWYLHMLKILGSFFQQNKF